MRHQSLDRILSDPFAPDGFIAAMYDALPVEMTIGNRRTEPWRRNKGNATHQSQSLPLGLSQIVRAVGVLMSLLLA